MGNAGGSSVLGKKSRKALDQNKTSDERVRFCLSGVRDQAIVALDERLLVIKPGWSAGAAFGAKVTSFNYSDIRGIEVRTSLMSAFIEVASAGFEAASGARNQVFETDEKRDPYKLPNCLPCFKSDLPKFKPYLDDVQRLIAESKRAPRRAATRPGSADATSVAEELQKLASLRDAGVLTDDEFRRAKGALLNTL